MPFGEAILSWTRNGEADLAGYRIYYGSSPIALNHITDVGLTATPLTPTHTLKTFEVYGQLNFAVTAYDTSNNENAFSTVVGKAVAPKLLPMAWG
jgi:hypothetical protein